MTAYRAIPVLFGLVVLTACATVIKPSQISANTYYLSKTNTDGVFGDLGAMAASLVAGGKKFCATKGSHFRLMSENFSPPISGRGYVAAVITKQYVD